MKSNRRLLKEFGQNRLSNKDLLDQFGKGLVEDETFLTDKEAREVLNSISPCLEQGERLLQERPAKGATDSGEWVAWRNHSLVCLKRAGTPLERYRQQFGDTVVSADYDELRAGVEILRQASSIAERWLHNKRARPQTTAGARLKDVDLAPEILHILAEVSRARSGITMIEVPSLAKHLEGSPDQAQLERVARLLESKGFIDVAGISPMSVKMTPSGYSHDELHYPPPASLRKDEPEMTTTTSKPTVFVVHGHDHAARDRIVAFLRKQDGFRTVVLEEEANRGKTIIEKFENHAREAAFAVVIATPDDVGCTSSALKTWDPLAKARLSPNNEELTLETIQVVPPPTRPRARQNVILEWGYFAGKLGRDRVMLVQLEGVELPSDLSGVLDTRGGDLELKLLRELRAADLDVDLNHL